jgi:hypothetical protein
MNIIHNAPPGPVRLDSVPPGVPFRLTENKNSLYFVPPKPYPRTGDTDPWIDVCGLSTSRLELVSLCRDRLVVPVDITTISTHDRGHPPK